VTIAEDLSRDLRAIFKFVHENIAFEPYFGSLKGSQRTLLKQGGNDFDTASLLIALLGASGIPARYAAGEMTIPIRDVALWLQIEDRQRAFDLLTEVMPAQAVLRQNGTIKSVEVTRVWARAFLAAEQRWVDLDASFKKVIETPRKLLRVTSLNPDEVFSDTLQTGTINEALPSTTNIDETVLTSSLEAAGVELAAFLDRRRRTPRKLTDETLFGRSRLIPAKHFLSSKPREVAEFSEFSDVVRHKIRVILPGLDHTLILPSRAAVRVTVTYTPGSLTPALQAAGEIVAHGLPAISGDIQTLGLEV
jgi:hypothetical protein